MMMPLRPGSALPGCPLRPTSRDLPHWTCYDEVVGSVFLVWHSYESDDDCGHAFLLGVYSTRSLADARVASARVLPGFRRYPDGFVIDE